MLDMRIITHVSYVVPHTEGTNCSEEKWNRKIHITEIPLCQSTVTKWICCLTSRFSLLELLFTCLNFQCLHQKLEEMGKNVCLCCNNKTSCNQLEIVSIAGSGCHYQEQSWINTFSHARPPLLPWSFTSISVVRGMVALYTQEESFFSFRSNQPVSLAPSFHAVAGIQTNDLALLNLLPLLRNSIISFSLSMPRSSKF